jgi:hypothetical protein
MEGTQRLLAIAIAALFAVRTGNGKVEVLGVVVQANHASLGSQPASEGTTLYDGDRLSTEEDGTLRLSIGLAGVQLAMRSSVILRDVGGGSGGKQFDAELLAGAAVLSVTAANEGEIVACSARVRPASAARGIVRVQILGPHELLVYAQRGAAEISYRSETETIAEGKAYRVMLNADDRGQDGTIAKAPAHGGKKILLIAVAVGAASALGVALAATSRQGPVESPDRP